MQCTIFFKDLTWSLPFPLEPASIQIFNINFLRAHALMEGKSSSDETRQCVVCTVCSGLSLSLNYLLCVCVDADLTFNW